MSDPSNDSPVMKTLWNWILYHEGVGKKPTLKYDPKSGMMFGAAKRKDYSRAYKPNRYQKWSHFE